MLQTETNTKSMERRIRAAARQILRLKHFNTVFEHGQWWIVSESLTFSVVDAEGPNTVDGFDFEEV